MSANTWIVLVQTYGGVVSLLTGLSEEEANAVRERLTPFYDKPGYTGCFTKHQADARQIDVFDGSARVDAKPMEASPYGVYPARDAVDPGQA
jgi:hypothetical protein